MIPAGNSEDVADPQLARSARFIELGGLKNDQRCRDQQVGLSIPQIRVERGGGVGRLLQDVYHANKKPTSEPAETERLGKTYGELWRLVPGADQ